VNKNSIIFNIAGLKYTDAVAVINKEVQLFRETYNAFGKNAVKVMKKDNSFISYVEKEKPSHIARILDDAPDSIVIIKKLSDPIVSSQQCVIELK